MKMKFTSSNLVFQILNRIHDLIDQLPKYHLTDRSYLARFSYLASRPAVESLDNLDKSWVKLPWSDMLATTWEVGFCCGLVWGFF